MKRFEFKVALHILIIFLLSIGSCLLYQRQLWFSTTVCILFLIGAGMNTVQANHLVTTIDGWTSLQRYDAESSSAFQK
jgi:hypothetical protein